MTQSISFIIPAYNEEKTLGFCLDSVLAELATFRGDSQIIVVNNASTDKTIEVAGKYSPVKLVNESRKGLVFARATGAKAATGDLLAHIDADCILPKGWLETVVKSFADDEKIVALSGPHVYFDLPLWQQVGVKIFYLFAASLHYLTGVQLQGGNFIVRKWAWEKIGETSSDFNFYGEDIELGRRLSKVGKVKFTLKLPILISGRRLKSEGFFKIGARYTLNYFSVFFFKKPATKKYKDIRLN